MNKKRLVLATGNKDKLREMQQILRETAYEILPQSRFDVPDVEETGLSFVENAIIKARNAARHTGLPAIADDSGLEVDALGGAPGIYSARYAGPGCSDADNNARLLSDLEDIAEPMRTARFQCLMVMLRHGDDPVPVVCQGTWEGRIAFSKRGDNGFGYDPLFVLDDGRHSAELTAEEKNRISHRARALEAVKQRLL